MLEAHRRSKAEEFGISAEEFAAILDEIAAKNISHAAPVKTQDFFARLHVEDLALARACAAGNERAWQVFMLRFREKLYDTGRQLTRDDATGKRAGGLRLCRFVRHQDPRRPPAVEAFFL